MKRATDDQCKDPKVSEGEDHSVPDLEAERQADKEKTVTIITTLASQLLRESLGRCVTAGHLTPELATGIHAVVTETLNNKVIETYAERSRAVK